MTAPDPTTPTRWALLRHPGFARFLFMRLAGEFAIHMQTVAVGWAVYELARSPFDLGLIGLSQFLPSLLLILVTGAVADRYPRNRVAALCLGVMTLTAGALLALIAHGAPPVLLIYVVISVFGTARAFYQPAQNALLANLVPGADLGRAVALAISGSKAAQMTAPVVGGALYALSPLAAFGATAALFAAGGLIAATIRTPPRALPATRGTASGLLDGFRYVRSQRAVFGAISLDMMAVFLAGATALLPVFASDVLGTGPVGLGLLYAATSAGSLLTALVLSVYPLGRNAGRTIFIAVGVFGAATIVFGLSEILALSMAALFVMGIADMISVNLRQTLVQVWTPDELRGRVNAINGVSLGVSNEVGQARAGLVATFAGAPAAVVIGGIGTLVVVLLWTRLFPELVAVKSLERKG